MSYDSSFGPRVGLITLLQVTSSLRRAPKRHPEVVIHPLRRAHSLGHGFSLELVATAGRRR
ncbi:hypothetical protein J7643_19385 [bacterium]|nr:hypothetical protein [bacterium]